MLCILVAALLATLGPEVDRSTPLNRYIGLSIALVAFQSAGQTVASRALQYSGLTTSVLTSNYCDLFSDPGLFKLGLRRLYCCWEARLLVACGRIALLDSLELCGLLFRSRRSW
jgi:hypothetical protein